MTVSCASSAHDQKYDPLRFSELGQFGRFAPVFDSGPAWPESQYALEWVAL